MGVIVIQTKGSFEGNLVEFSAQEGGHAQAIAKAIAWLSNEVLPAAIKQDHSLQHNGSFPKDRFGLPEPDDDFA